MKKSFLYPFFLLALLLDICHSAQIDGNPFYIYQLTAKFDSVVQTNYTRYKIPGMAVAVIYNDNVIYKNCLGVCDINNKRPVDEHTLFRLASLSKGFTAVLTGIMANEGYLDLDSKVTDFIPHFKLSEPDATRQLTIRNLLSHTSGLPSYAGTEYLENNISWSMLINLLAAIPLNAPPGTQYNYQNVVFSLSGDILNTVTGRDYADLITDTLFKPLNMSDATIGRNALLSNENHAVPHILDDSSWVSVPVNQNYYNVPPAAGINASISDMCEWVSAMMGYREYVIPDDVIRQVSSPVVLTPKTDRYYDEWPHLLKASYGMGWRVLNYSGRDILYHGGYVQGFRAEIAIDPQDKTGIVLLMNCAAPFADNFVPEFFDLLFNEQKK